MWPQDPHETQLVSKLSESLINTAYIMYEVSYNGRASYVSIYSTVVFDRKMLSVTC